MAYLNDNYTLHEITLRSEIEMMELNKRKAEGSIMESTIYSRDKSSCRLDQKTRANGNMSCARIYLLSSPPVLVSFSDDDLNKSNESSKLEYFQWGGE